VREPDRGGPDWVREGLRQLVREVRSFARTAFEFTLHPTRFAKEWATGTRHALNPVGFLATAFAVLAPFDAVFAHLTHHDDSTSEPLLRAAAGAILPFGYYLLVGALQHGVLRLCVVRHGALRRRRAGVGGPHRPRADRARHVFARRLDDGEQPAPVGRVAAHAERSRVVHALLLHAVGGLVANVVAMVGTVGGGGRDWTFGIAG